MTEFRGEKKKERNIDCYVSGASDPYVKVKSGGRLLHKSRTVHRDLNPVWDESVTLPIEDPFQPLTFKVNFSIVPFVRTINPSIIIIIIIIIITIFVISRNDNYVYRKIFIYIMRAFAIA